MRPARNILLMTAVLLIPAALCAQSAVDQAVALFEKHQYGEAAKLLAAAVEAEPGNAKAHAYYGMALANSTRDLDGAVAHLEKATALAPTSSHYQVWLGAAYSSKAGTAGLFKAASLAGKAKAAFERAVQLNPASVEARGALLDYYLLAPGIVGGSVAKAREQAAAVASMDPYQGHLASARIAEYEKKWADAEKAYRAALALKDDRGVLHNQLGYLLLRQGHNDDAVGEFRRYVELDPADANSHDSLGEGLAAAGKLDDSVASYRKALELNPSFPSAVWGLADGLDKLDRRDEAKAQYTRYLELVPKGGHAGDARKRLSKP